MQLRCVELRFKVVEVGRANPSLQLRCSAGRVEELGELFKEVEVGGEPLGEEVKSGKDSLNSVKVGGNSKVDEVGGESFKVLEGGLELQAVNIFA